MKTSGLRTVTFLSLCFGLLFAFAPSDAAAQTFRPEAPRVNALMTGFGGAVAVGEEAVFVGEAQNRYVPGLVYVYRKEGGQWNEALKIEAPEAAMNDQFGRALAVEGGTLLVGGTVPGESERGAVYVFHKEGGAWQPVTHFAPEASDSSNSFGSRFIFSGDRAFVSAPEQDSARGTVYVFERAGEGAWEQRAALTGSTAEAGAYFGFSLAADGDRLFIGAPGPLQGGGDSEVPGAVYVFERAADGTWAEQTVLTGPEGEEGHWFGFALAHRDSLTLVGAPRYGATGMVFAYQPQEENGWETTGRLLPYEGAENTVFGMAVTLMEDGAWVGAPGAAGFEGRIYRFAREGESWTASSKLAPDSLSSRSTFGAPIAVRRDVAVAGALRGELAVLFERTSAGTWEAQRLLKSTTVDAMPAISGESVRCTDGEAALYDCNNVTLLSFLPIQALGGDLGTNLNDIWGWTDPETGTEYALAGRTDGTAFVDISDPMHPVYIGEVPMTEGAQESAWRDIKIYENHAFIVSDAAGEHGMQVFDLTRLREFEGEPITFEPETVYHEIHSAHNLFINTETGFAYVVGAGGGGTTCGGGLHMVNIQDPENPTFAGCFADERTGRRGTGYSHDAQCVVYHGPDTEHQGQEICFGFNETALSIADVTDKDTPEALAVTPYPKVGYSHQGWVTEDHRYLYMNDELDELSGQVQHTRTLVWDITDLEDPQLIQQYTYGTTSSDHNLYIRDGLMYQSNYASGLRIHDVSDPEHPQQVGFLDTTPVDHDEAGFTGTWSNYPFFESGVIPVSSIGEGLFLVRYTPEQAL